MRFFPFPVSFTAVAADAAVVVVVVAAEEEGGGSGCGGLAGTVSIRLSIIVVVVAVIVGGEALSGTVIGSDGTAGRSVSGDMSIVGPGATEEVTGGGEEENKVGGPGTVPVPTEGSAGDAATPLEGTDAGHTTPGAVVCVVAKAKVGAAVELESGYTMCCPVDAGGACNAGREP